MRITFGVLSCPTNLNVFVASGYFFNIRFYQSTMPTLCKVSSFLFLRAWIPFLPSVLKHYWCIYDLLPHFAQLRKDFSDHMLYAMTLVLLFLIHNPSITWKIPFISFLFCFDSWNYIFYKQECSVGFACFVFCPLLTTVSQIPKNVPSTT